MTARQFGIGIICAGLAGVSGYIGYRLLHKDAEPEEPEHPDTVARRRRARHNGKQNHRPTRRAPSHA